MKTNFFLQMTKIICFLACMCLSDVANAQAANWWDNNALIVEGTGCPPANAATLEQTRSYAKRAAMLDGYRKLAAQAKEIRITAKKTIGSQIVAGEISNTKIAALINGAKILSEKFDDNGICTVVLSVPLYGVNDSVAHLACKPFAKKNFSPPTENSTPAKGNYTGLIIDCGNADLNPVLLPAILNENNQAVYAYNNLDRDKIISGGMVSYIKKDGASNKFMPLSFVKSPNVDGKFLLLNSVEVKNISRAGDNPLVIKATALCDDNTCPIISAGDSDKILAENQISHFLDAGAVVFVGYRVGGVRA